MHNLKRKGLSSLIQVMLLSVLSIMAISVVWGYVSDLSNNLENQLSPAVDCIAQQSQIRSACLNTEGKIQLDLEIGLGEEISYLDVNFLGESFACGQMCSSCNLVEEQGRKTVYLDPQSPVSTSDRIAAAINRCLPEILDISSC